MIHKTIITKLVLLLIFSAILSHFSYAQKQVQQLFFPQEGYVLGAKNHSLGVGYTDGTMGSVNISEAVIKNLDASKTGLQTISVEYDGISRQYQCIVDSRSIRKIPASEFLSLIQQSGYDTKFLEKINITNDVVSTFLDYYTNFVWIVKPEKFFVDCEATHYCGCPLSYTCYVNGNIEVTPDNINGFDNSRAGRQQITFEYAGMSFNTTIEMVGADFIIDFPSIVYREPEHNADFKVLFTNGIQKSIPFKDGYIYGYDTIKNYNTLKNREENITVKFGNKEQNLFVAMAFFNSVFFPKTLLRGDSSQFFDVLYYDSKVMPVSIKKASFSGLDLNRAGSQRIILNYLGFSHSTEVEVIDIDSVKFGNLKHINNTSYYEYPTNNYIKDFTVYYHDGTVRNVDINNASISGLDITRPGVQNVTLTYAGKQFTTKINVWEKPAEFDFSGLSDTIFQFRTITGTFKAVYKDGSSKNVDIANAFCQLYSDDLGKHHAVITWHSHSQLFDVEVVANTKRPVTLNMSRIKTDLLIYDHLRGNIKALYSDGSSDLFDVKYADYHLDTETIGKKKIKISWHGCTTSLNVNVKDDPAKPIATDGYYQLENIPQVKWFIRAMVAANTGGYDAVLSTKLFSNVADSKNAVAPKVEGFTLSTTIKGVTQTHSSKSARFTSAQRQLIKDAFNADATIIIKDVKAKSSEGQILDLGSLAIEL
ncbi:MAG: bacterial Ig-like domain-containing protein [Bacteroidales bacterium]|nr:bacterial Ig-like domain-containing protein [Bacteroidales bacterium]